jgi:hypothetical protein
VGEAILILRGFAKGLLWQDWGKVEHQSKPEILCIAIYIYSARLSLRSIDFKQL